MRDADHVIEVRDAVIEDADAIATAHIDGWRVGYRGVVPDEYLDTDDFANYRREIWHSWTWQSYVGSRLFVVTLQGRVIGFGHAGPADDAEQSADDAESSGAGRGEIHSFYLHPSAWGSGGAGALMSRCEEFLRDEGFTTAVLWVLRDNPRARAFYEKAGWHATGRETTFVPADTRRGKDPTVQWVVTEYEARL